jgi:hypothetical protein
MTSVNLFMATAKKKSAKKAPVKEKSRAKEKGTGRKVVACY